MYICKIKIKTLNTTHLISEKINYLPRGYIFTYSDFLTEENQSKEAIIKALNRMAQVGKIEKLSKGKFYKPETTSFGKLSPNNYQIVKDLLIEDGKVIGYLTGVSIYSELGFTTQISNSIQIGKNDVRPSFNRGNFNISIVRQKNIINKENIPYLQLLDILRFIKKIPDTTPEEVVMRLMEILKGFKEKDFKAIIRLSMKYQSAIRAILGAILERMNIDSDDLKKSLNPISTYEIKGVSNVLPNAKNWNIK